MKKGRKRERKVGEGRGEGIDGSESGEEELMKILKREEWKREESGKEWKKVGK